MIYTAIFTSFPDLRLPDGRIAESLDRFELARTLAALGVVDVNASTGKTDALRAYSKHLDGIKQAAVAKHHADQAQGDAA